MSYKHMIMKTLAAAALAALSVPAAAEPETRSPIKLFFVGASDSDFINAVYGEVIKEYGYRVRYVRSDFSAHFLAVENGDIDITLGAWQTIPEMTEAALATGKVKNFGPTGVKVVEGWWYTNELVQYCPGLPDWTAFKNPDCIKALASADTAPLGRYVDAPADWASDSADFIKKEGLQIANVNSGSAAALVTELKAAVDQKKPFMGWGYEPHWVINDTLGSYVQRPGFRPVNEVLKLGNIEATNKIPNAVHILEKFVLSREEVAAAMDRVDNGGLSVEDAAREWMAANEAVWKAWLPAD
ncbi:glycine betaine ABC transporter substrate-binding protein [Thauera sp. SDU_THAU2]|uniref:glycine betaine ABC transporter substrate-binding protein n=1 Tax=Thauera sp. SDU_THAU2 TaxID=3136633 RepID=UPI00311F820E